MINKCVCATIAVLFLFICPFLLQHIDKEANVPLAKAQVLIDPGHGGEDGGTGASDGTLEKNINLSISRDLYALFYVCGFSVDMTRYTDVSIHDEDCVTTREMKSSDMRNRLSLYEKADVIISIHQNHYSVAKYHGAQVFFSTNVTQSEVLAKAVQKSIVEQLQPDNTRQIKKATDGIYLLYHTTRPAILVECGFLSNPEECEKLKDTAYQQKLAFAVFSGYIAAEGIGR